VGSRQWTQCVEDQATGGGLMPWIVVIPLGVMVVGMMIGFARQFSGAGRERAKAHGASGSAGTWLIFVSFVELAIGAGSWVAEQKAPGEGGGFSIAATVLLGVGALLFVIGVYLKIRGRRRARIYHSGVPGDAVIKAVNQTGVMVNNQPMYGFDLEVTGQGFAPVATTHREVVPFWYLNRVGPGERVPVKVDPSNPTRVIFDWDRLAATPAQPGGAPAAAAPMGTALTNLTAANMGQGAVPSADSLANAMEAARELTARSGSGWHAGKAIGWGITLFVLLIVGAGLYFVAQVFGAVGDVTNEVTGQVADAIDEAEEGFNGQGRGKGGGNAATTIEVSRAAKGREPVTFSLALPVGWNDVTGAIPERQGAVVIDVVMQPAAGEARIVVTRSVQFLEKPAAAGADISTVRADYEREFGDSIARSRMTQLAGEPAVVLDLAPGADGLQSRQVAVMREGQVVLVNLTAPKGSWGPMLRVFDQVLESWSWGAVSA
jgi:hypothetical protein